MGNGARVSASKLCAQLVHADLRALGVVGAPVGTQDILVVKHGSSRRYALDSHGLGAIAALSILREQVLKPLLAAANSALPPSKLTTRSTIDDPYQALRAEMQGLFGHLHLAAA